MNDGSTDFEAVIESQASYIRDQTAEIERLRATLARRDLLWRKGAIEARQCLENDFGGRYGAGMSEAGRDVLAALGDLADDGGER